MLWLIEPTTTTPTTRSTEQLVSAVQDAQRIIIVLVAFVSTGVATVIAAWQRVKVQIRSVEAKVNPVSRQLTEPKDGAEELTIKEKINGIHAELKIAKAQRDQIAEILQRHDEVLKERSAALAANTASKQQLDQTVRDLMNNLQDRRQDVRALQRRNIEKIEGVENLINESSEKLDTIVESIDHIQDISNEIKEDVREVRSIILVILPRKDKDRDGG